MTLEATFSDRLVQARSMLGWSQADLGKVAGVAAAQISRYESGTSHPRPQVVGKLADALNVSFAWLSKGVGPITADDPSNSKAPPGRDTQAVELPEDLYVDLLREAEKQQISLEAMTLRLLRQAMARDAEQPGRASANDALTPQQVKLIEETVRQVLETPSLRPVRFGTPSAIQVSAPEAAPSKKTPKK